MDLTVLNNSSSAARTALSTRALTLSVSVNLFGVEELFEVADKGTDEQQPMNCICIAYGPRGVSMKMVR